MADFDIVGEKVFEWLQNTPADKWTQLIGCGLDDGKADDPWPIQDVERDVFVLVAPGSGTIKRLPWSTVRRGCLVVPDARRALRETNDQGRPAELVALEKVRHRVRQLGFDPDRFGSSDELRSIDRIYSKALDKRIVPGRAETHIVYEAAMKAQQMRAAIPWFSRWLVAIEKRRHPQVDPIMRLQLSALYRHSGQLHEALEVSEVVDLPPDRFPANDHERAMLCCHRAATLMDMFEANGDDCLLPRAERHLSIAWAHEKGEEVSNTYSRYRRLLERLEAGEEPVRPFEGRS